MASDGYFMNGNVLFVLLTSLTVHRQCDGKSSMEHPEGTETATGIADQRETPGGALGRQGDGDTAVIGRAFRNAPSYS